MKKFAFGFGLLFLGLAVLPFVQASRLRYHQYLYEQSAQGNHETRALRRRNAPSSISILRPVSEEPNDRYFRGHQNLGYDQENTRDYYSKQRQYYGNYAERHASSRIRFASPINTRSDRMEVEIPLEEAAVQDYVDYENFQGMGVSFKVPAGWTQTTENGVSFENPDNSFVITLKTFSDKLCEGNYHFEGCAVNLSKSENAAAVPGRGEIELLSRPVRQKQWNGDVEAGQMIETLQESFVGRDMGGEWLFLNRYFVRKTTGEIYLLQTKVAYEEAPWFLGVSKTVFDSFRVVTTEVQP